MRTKNEESKIEPRSKNDLIFLFQNSNVIKGKGCTRLLRTGRSSPSQRVVEDDVDSDYEKDEYVRGRLIKLVYFELFFEHSRTRMRTRTSEDEDFETIVRTSGTRTTIQKM